MPEQLDRKSKPVTRRQVLCGLASSAVAVGAGPALLSACGIAKTPSVRLPKDAISGFSGRVIRRGDADYENWRQSMTWQMLKPDRFPELILRPSSVGDVETAVRFAADRGLQIAVKSGGHNVWSSFMRDGGCLLDMSEFNQVSIQANAGTAEVGPALWARDLIQALSASDSAFPVAHCATVPLGGYLLGGGIGLNGDEWGGIACYSVLGADVVTATGERARVSTKNHTDLLWALRGGGAGFPGVVTGYQLRTYRRPAGVFSSTYVFPLAALDEAVTLLEAMVAEVPANTELLALFLHNPAAPADSPPGSRKACAVRAQVFADDELQARPVLDAMARHPAAQSSVFQLANIAESYESLFVASMDWRRGFGFGHFAVENVWTNSMRAAMESIAGIYVEAPSWKSHVVVQPKLSKIPDDAGAYSMIGDAFIGVYSVWDDAERSSQNKAWLRTMSTHLDSYAAGHYINEIDAASDQERVKRSFSPDAWYKLRKIRTELDSAGVFHDFPGFS